MAIINSIFQKHAHQYFESLDKPIPIHLRKVIKAICLCRTGELGLCHYQCPDCEHSHYGKRSCGNRHCPQCQGQKAAHWLQRQLKTRLPCNYFMLTFTLPDKLRSFVEKNQQLAYSFMFDAAAYAIKKLSKDKRHIGCESTGFCAVLHTWGRQLQYHPHLHVIIPAGGVNQEGTQWLPSRDDFFLPVKALSKIFRGKFKELVRDLDSYSTIEAKQWNRGWNVHCQLIGNGEEATKYLARYVFRVGISNHRIQAVSDTHVTISYKKVGSNRKRSLKLTIHEFIRRFLQHVLPSGFMKIRHYGLMSPNSKIPLDHLRELVKDANNTLDDCDYIEINESKKLLCPHCQTQLVYQSSLILASPNFARIVGVP
ncbi:MAG: transposase [Cyclobacteriaceae bacterium]|nr:transposase [Cyclobacteriaceae bacterium]